MSCLFRKARPFLAFAALVSLTYTAPVSAQQTDCSNASSTVEINACEDKNYQAADAALNEAYEAALKYARSRQLEKPYDAKSFEDALVKAERAWVSFRDADCKDVMAQKWSGGTGTTSAILACMTAKTLQRTKELKEDFRDE
jgi:uncharacterized protein YecT (DUF1311 family)